MRRFILSICLFFIVVAASAQLITASTGGIPCTPVSGSGVDYVFMFKDIRTAEITYNGTYVDQSSITWTPFTNDNSPNKVNPFSPEGDTGYRLTVDGNKIADIWVIDYKAPTLSSIVEASSQPKECKSVDLKIESDVSELTYQNYDGKQFKIPRNFELKYNTLSWSGTAWAPKDTTITISSPIASQKSVPAPYCSTKFTLSGDQFAEGLNLTKASVSSISTYTPVAVICHETSVVSTRNATNEADRPTTAKQISGSAPLDMIFYSNPNDPIVKNYNWEIFKDKSKTSIIGGRTDPTTPYTFTESGSYVVKVTVSNDKACSFSDSVTVTVSTSSIVAPNVFTPNGDGFNDEFRVAYKSITSFHCWIYNRWGRLVYEWTDPMKGWDGNIGGKKAAPGAYFYIIKALGSDYDPNSKADSKTKLRVGEYKLKGDINLLRGADN